VGGWSPVAGPGRPDSTGSVGRGW